MEKKVIERWRELPFLYKVQIWSYLLAGICGAIAFDVNMPVAFILLLVSLIGFQVSDIYVYIKVRNREKDYVLP